MDDLDAFLDQGTQPLAEPTDAIEHPPEDTGPPRDDHGRFAPKETGVEQPQETVEPVPPTADKLPPDTFKGLKEEREKRQTLERELDALKQQIAAFQQPQTPPPPPPSLWEDEQGWQQHFGSTVVTTAVQQASLNAKLDMSEMMVRQANADFDEVKAEFLRLAEANPTLREQALSDPHPWNKAYQIAKNHRAMQELGATNVAELEAKLREKIAAEMQAQTPAPKPSLPVSLADSQSARVSPSEAPRMLSLEEILRR